MLYIMDDKKKGDRKKRAISLNNELGKMFPKAKVALNFKTPWELTVAVQLSAQCTDKKVNEVTKDLFIKYPDLPSYLDVKPVEFQKAIHPTGFYKNKTKNILAAAKKIKEEFGGVIPNTMEELTSIPGIARKSANVILGNSFGKVEGIVVDTHMLRFSKRFDLSDGHPNAVKVEKGLMEVLPKNEWLPFALRVVEYGRAHGNPRGNKDLHEIDPLLSIYPGAKNFWPK